MKYFKNWVSGIFVMICMVALSSLMVINMVFVYDWVIGRYHLVEVTGVSRASLLENYWVIIKYVQLPWIPELHMPDFIMSETGRIHFEEVKVIFLVLYVFLIVGIIFWVASLIKKRSVLPVLNRGANLTMIIFFLLTCFILFDFSTAFVWFHHLFFNNDYWLFHPLFDPVILALPEELFLIKGFLIIGILFIFCLTIKVLHRHYHSNNRLRA
ncbi:MAG: TIGR01906 family membrane protein [Turicibacter sp.]|nr:TIGR01906 family membrane protein [Turicibacter sp.]